MDQREVPVVSRARKLRAADQALRSDASFQSLLYHYTDKLYRAGSLDMIYEAALAAICEGLRSDRASILRFDAKGSMRFVAWRGISDRYRAAVDGHSPWTAGERGAEIICIRDVTRSAEWRHLQSAILAENIRGLCFIPLAPDDRVIGKFMVYFGEPHALSAKEQELALIIARQLGFALRSYMADNATRRLAALVESSDDAIVSKTLEGIITSWNDGAERLFGYSADEAIGRPVTILIPEERLGEEQQILSDIRAGRRVQSYETVRRCRDGRLIDVSLTISPVRDGQGTVIGASKIARDIGDRRRAAEAQTMLLRELNHRVKNAYTIANSLINLSAGSVQTPQELAAAVSGRLVALAQAHSLSATALPTDGSALPCGGTLQEIISIILAPFGGKREDGRQRIVISGDDRRMDGSLTTQLALLFHELAINAAKYGSLSIENGQVNVTLAAEPGQVVILWRESGGPPVTEPVSEGFGSKLLRSAAYQLGDVIRSWHREGLAVRIVVKMAVSEEMR